MIDDVTLASVLSMLAARAENNGDAADSLALTTANQALTLAAQALEIVTKLTRTPTPSGADLREMDTDYVVSDTDPALLFYTVQLDVTAGLLSSEEVAVELTVNGSLVVPGLLYANQLLGLVNVGFNPKVNALLVAFVQPGDVIRLAKTGDGDAAVVAQVELVFA